MNFLQGPSNLFILMFICLSGTCSYERGEPTLVQNVKQKYELHSKLNHRQKKIVCRCVFQMDSNILSFKLVVPEEPCQRRWTWVGRYLLTWPLWPRLALSSNPRKMSKLLKVSHTLRTNVMADLGHFMWPRCFMTVSIDLVHCSPTVLTCSSSMAKVLFRMIY
jgi:hypothetical protein